MSDTGLKQFVMMQVRVSLRHLVHSPSLSEVFHACSPVELPLAVRKAALQQFHRGLTAAATCRACQLFLRSSVQFRTRSEGPELWIA
jgi:hypothetical protein